jgi:NAD(P)-dependent dehydrogenase (short-subunit alcohol dehydrogenase family)
MEVNLPQVELFDSENNAGIFTPEITASVSARTPVKRFGQSDDLKAAIVFLASPGSKFTTGQSIVVDGGWTAW